MRDSVVYMYIFVYRVLSHMCTCGGQWHMLESSSITLSYSFEAESLTEAGACAFHPGWQTANITDPPI